MDRQPPSLAPAPVDGPYCRNCGALADVSFCPVCGQETRIEMPTVGHFVAEFAEQTLALQGQLWRTLLSLLFKPGQLTLEYVAGRRQRYVRPLRLYLALSILFFAVLSLSGNADIMTLGSDDQAELDAARERVRAKQAVPATDAKPSPVTPGVPVDKNAPPAGDGKPHRPSPGDVDLDTGHPSFDARVNHRINELLLLPTEEMTRRIFDTFTAWAPVAMFFLMPLFAAFLKLGLLWRRVHYAVHLLFAVNFHSFIFMMLLLSQLPGIRAIGDLLAPVIPVYLWFALRRVHGGGAVLMAVFVVLLFFVYVVAMALVMAASTAIPLALL